MQNLSQAFPKPAHASDTKEQENQQKAFCIVGFGLSRTLQTRKKQFAGIDNIGIFEFIFKGLPEPPELEGVDEDGLRDLQNAIQEQLCKRDKDRERNITKTCKSLKRHSIL